MLAPFYIATCYPISLQAAPNAWLFPTHTACFSTSKNCAAPVTGFQLQIYIILFHSQQQKSPSLSTSYTWASSTTEDFMLPHPIHYTTAELEAILHFLTHHDDGKLCFE
jgi:hypothetical protein